MNEVPNTAKASKKRHEESIVQKYHREAEEKQQFNEKHKKLKNKADQKFNLNTVQPEDVVTNGNKNLIYPHLREKKKKDKEERLSADKQKKEEEDKKRKEELIKLKEKVKKQKEQVKSYKEEKEAARLKEEEE